MKGDVFADHRKLKDAIALGCQGQGIAPPKKYSVCNAAILNVMGVQMLCISRSLEKLTVAALLTSMHKVSALL